LRIADEEAAMLVLTRKPDQSIIIGDGIEVEVLSVAGEKVRLGIKAPREVEIFRHEVYERIQDERRSAGQREPAETSENGTSPSRSAAEAEPAGRRRR
jgi:carbon storage regulator